MHFSSRYTRVTISPRSRPGGPVTNYVQLTLTVALEVNLLAADVNTPQLVSLIQTSLNRHAAGVRNFNRQRYEIEWTLRLVDRSFVQQGTALGISLVPDSMLTSVNADGMFCTSQMLPGDNTRVSRILLGGGFARQALSPRRSEAQVGRTGFGNAAAHEVGHSQDVTHQAGTLMDETNTTRLDRFMSDAQVYEILRRHIPEMGGLN